jgi:hypothetical protein
MFAIWMLNQNSGLSQVVGMPPLPEFDGILRTVQPGAQIDVRESSIKTIGLQGP